MKNNKRPLALAISFVLSLVIFIWIATDDSHLYR